MTQILFIIFNIAFFLIGRSLFNLFNLFSKNKFELDKQKIFGLNIYVFYPLISLFFISNLVFILNFIFQIKVTIPYIFTVLVLLIFLNFFYIKNLSIFKFKFLTFILFPVFLSISSHGIWLGWDTGLYHLQNQAWIRESNLVLGLSNLNVWLGWSSIYEYLSSLFWLADNYVVTHFLKLVIYNFFFCFLIHNIFENKNKYLKFSSLGVLLFSILDNIGYLGGGNGFTPILTIGKFDDALGILFFVNCVLIFMRVMDQSFSKLELSFIFYFSLFGFQIKQNGAYVIFPLIIYVYFYMKKNNVSFVKILNSIKFPILLGVLWVLKNVLVTSCLLYPVAFTCISNFDWYGIDTNYATEGWLIGPAIDPRLDETVTDQFIYWLNDSKNKQYTYNFLLSLTIIFIVNKIFLVKASNKIKTKESKALILFFIFLILIWFNSNGANPRYGFGTWLFAITLFYKNYQNLEIRPFFKNYLKLIVLTTVIVSVGLVPRLYSYQAFLNNPISFSVIGLPWEEEYIKSKFNYGVYTESGLCWNYVECHHIDKPINYDDSLFFKKYTTQSSS